MKILAIDPGTRFAGFAVLEKKNRKIQLLNYGLLKMKAKDHLSIRIGEFYTFFKKKLIESEIKNLCLETPFLYKNAGTFLKLGYMRGILYLLAYEFGLKIHEYSPCEVKQATCLKGNATKEQVAHSVYKYFPNLERNLKDDVTDAIAVGLGHLTTTRLYKPN